MIKVLNIITNGLNFEGITTTQLEFVKRINRGNYGVHIDMAVVEQSNPAVVEEFRSYGCDIVDLISRKKSIVLYSKKLRKYLRENHYDVVHVHGSSAIMYFDCIAAKKAGIKKIIAHSRNTMNKHRTLDFFLRPLFYKSFNIALSCGEDAGTFLFKKHKFVVMNNGKDMKKYSFNQTKADSFRKEYGYGEHDVLIGFAGNINDQKNVFFLADIFKIVNSSNDNYRLVIAGDGPLMTDLRNRFAEDGTINKVLFLGRIKDTSQMIQAMDIMVLPSKYEGLPNVVLEWQISGLDSLVSNAVTPACKHTDFVEFLPIDNPKIWSDVILSKCHMSESDRVRRSAEGCIKMKKDGLDIEDCVEKMVKIYVEE